MNKSKIEWCDMTWNPITGCYHDCPYCYARKIAVRFGGHKQNAEEKGCVYALNEKAETPYPFDFYPTIHRYRLDEPSKKKAPQNIFVCSMADLFGDWIPAEYINEVLEACRNAPQHRYLFLTKNPKRYNDIFLDCINCKGDLWFGTTITNAEDTARISELPIVRRCFLSIEPIVEDVAISAFKRKIGYMDWVIIGAETGTRKNKVIPERKWIEKIVELCDLNDIPVFVKDSLSGIMGEDMRRDFPW